MFACIYDTMGLELFFAIIISCHVDIANDIHRPFAMISKISIKSTAKHLDRKTRSMDA